MDPSTSLFTVVDLSTVWVVADMHERDFARVRVGSDALVTFPVYEQLSLRGRVDYIDPQVSPDTRTARIRVEVPNPRGDLRLGMYADVGVTGAPNSSAAVIPRRCRAAWRPLPLNEAVAIEFTAKQSGEIVFACGMDMLKGLLVIE